MFSARHKTNKIRLAIFCLNSLFSYLLFIYLLCQFMSEVGGLVNFSSLFPFSFMHNHGFVHFSLYFYLDLL